MIRTKKSEIKKMHGIKRREDLAEGKIGELENKAIETTQDKAQLENRT